MAIAPYLQPAVDELRRRTAQSRTGPATITPDTSLATVPYTPTFEDIYGMLPIAGESPYTEQARRRMEVIAGGNIPAYQRLLGKSSRGFLQRTSAPEIQKKFFEPYLQSRIAFRRGAAEDPLTQELIDTAVRQQYQQLTEQLLPQLRHQALETGTLGSAKTGVAAAQALERFGNVAGNIRANLLSQRQEQLFNELMGTGQLAQAGYGILAQRQPFTSNLVNQLLGLSQAQTGIYGQLGAQDQLRQQQIIDYIRGRIEGQRQVPEQALSRYLGAIGSVGPLGGTGAQTSQTTGRIPAQGSGAAGTAGLILSLLGLAAAPFTSGLSLAATPVGWQMATQV